MSTWILVESVFHLINSSLNLNCSFFSLVLLLNSCWTMMHRTLMNHLWWLVLSRLQLFKLLFQLLYFLLNIFLLRHSVRISYWRLTLCILWSLFSIFSWSPSLPSLQPINDHSNKLLIITKWSEILNWRKVLIHLTILFNM